MEVVMLSRFYVVCVALLLLAGHAFGEVVSIQYTVTQVGTTGNTFVYDYTVDNNGTLPGMAPVQLFDIFFDPTLYQETSLANVTPDPLNSEWTPIILFSVGGNNPPAFDAESDTAGIATGTSVSGFEVEFNWLGQGLPGDQPFEIDSPSNFSTIQIGVTQPPPGVPEPATGPCMFGLLLVYGAWLARRKLATPLRRA
jgi:hypothetical protein